MTRLSAVVITRNEESNIGRCLASVKFADELVIVDSGSTDRTLDIARSYGARIFTLDWAGFGAAKQEGVSRASGKWVLSIDADEEVPPQLAKEITAKVTAENGTSGYFIKRRTMFLGRWILHCGWYPDYVLRLFLREKGRFDDALVHEKVLTNGPIDYLENELLHYSYPNLEQYLIKFNRYTTLGAEESRRRGKRAAWSDIVVRPPISFIKHYIVKQGFRDGLEGFVLSVLSSVSVMVKYAKLRAMLKSTDATKVSIDE